MPRDALSLRQKGRTPAWVALTWRALLALALISVALAVHWFDRAGLKDNHDGVISFVDVLYFTVITVTTVGYGDIVPVSDQARLFDTFVLTPIRLFIWLIFLGTAYDFVFKRVWERYRMSVIQDQLTNHYVVIGHGQSGSEALSELIRNGVEPDKIVVIDCDAEPLAAAEACGAAILVGDATRDATLEAVKIDRARAVMVAAGRDDTTILTVLTIRKLAPDVPVSAVIASEDNESLARQAGAGTVINPASFAGVLLAGSTHGPHLADTIADLAGAGGRVALRERPVRDEEIGKPLASAGQCHAIRLYRGGVAACPWDSAARVLEAGDVIVEMVPGDQ